MSKRSKTAKAPEFTLDEIKTYLGLYQKFDELLKKGFRERILMTVGIESRSEEQPALKALEGALIDIVAQRLRRNRHDVSLLSYRDVTRFIPAMADAILSIDGAGTDEAGKKLLEKSIKAALKNLEGLFSGGRRMRGKRMYNHHWKWMRTAKALAQEKGVAPHELFTVEGTYKEMIRRLFTKRTFSMRLSRLFKYFLRGKMAQEKIVMSVLTILAKNDKEMLEKMKRHFEKELKPRLDEMASKAHAVMQDTLDTEVVRAFGA